MIKENAHILITGGVRGIGRAIALRFAEYKANIHIWDINDNGYDSLESEIKDKGALSTFAKVNVAVFSEVENAVQSLLNDTGSIDTVINNAGITRDNLLMGMKEDDWDSVIAVNLKGTYNVSKHVIKTMIRKRSGSIINIASVIGIMGNKGQANYAASKAGIIGFTKSLAKEVGSRNVRVNAIAPGFIETEMTKQLPEDVIEAYAKLIPLGKMGQPEDVADLCVFLASDMSQYITGQVINVDGGMLM